MKFLLISGNPKQEGLCHEAETQILQGAQDAGATTEVLHTSGLDTCKMCSGGWGICLKERRCQFGQDSFNARLDTVRGADLICFTTPVYWGEVSEGLKTFMDKLRRCEFGPKGTFAGKKLLLVASAGGTGKNGIACLEQMERFCRHTEADIFDFVYLNRRNRHYKLVAAYQAAKTFVEQSAT